MKSYSKMNWLESQSCPMYQNVRLILSLTTESWYENKPGGYLSIRLKSRSFVSYIRINPFPSNDFQEQSDRCHQLESSD